MRSLWSFVSAVNFVVICLVIVSVSGCATPAAKAVKRGDELLTTKNYYGASEEYLTALRLESDNKDAKLKLCQTANQAYNQKLETAVNFERSSDFESALSQYTDLAEFINKSNLFSCLSVKTIDAKQKIAEMRSGASEKYYKDAEKYFSSSDYSNAINSYQEALKHNDPYKDCKNKMAESNYRLAQAQVKSNNNREAADYFTKANNIVEGYKDATTLATKYKGIADEKDAQSHYDKGVTLAKSENYRDASEQFEKATSFVATFKDSQSLAIKYKAKADEKDAVSHFEQGMSLVKTGSFREAAEQFEKSNSFVSNFKDSQSLSSKYKSLADGKDAQSHYESGQAYLAKNNFAEAEKEFLAADGFIKGYKDAVALAEKARNAMPNDNQVASAVQRALQKEIPVSWVGNLGGGRNAQLSAVNVQKIGIYNDRERYWPMRIRVAGKCLLNDPFNQGKVVSFDKIADFVLVRDDYGDWQASMRGGMFQ